MKPWTSGWWGGMEAFFLGAEYLTEFLVFCCQINGFDCFISYIWFLPQMWPIKERFTTSNHYINTIADFSDSQAANTGWNCPEWGGEETSRCFLCKWQEDTTGSSKHFHGKMDPWTQDRSRPCGKQQLWISAQLSLRRWQGAATAALGSQMQAGFCSTFSLWDEATSHLAAGLCSPDVLL